MFDKAQNQPLLIGVLTCDTDHVMIYMCLQTREYDIFHETGAEGAEAEGGVLCHLEFTK